MTYRMKVVICNPETPAGMISDLMFNLMCYFIRDEDDYGRKTYLNIVSDDERFAQYYDLRYDKSYERGQEMRYLTDWAYWYWSGKKGAYKVKYIEVSHA